MKKLVLFLVFVIFFTFVSCDSMFGPSEDDYFTLEKKNYTGSELRIDGFYYQKWDNDTKFNNVTFLYTNGVVFDGGGSREIKDMENYVNSLYSDPPQQKSFWGLFTIDSNKIIYERVVGTDQGYFVYQEEGIILNDTTFLMTSVSRMKQGVKTDSKDIDRTYYFQQYSPKPDSTNKFF